MEKFDVNIPEFIAKPPTYVSIQKEELDRLIKNYKRAINQNLITGLIIGLALTVIF